MIHSQSESHRLHRVQENIVCYAACVQYIQYVVVTGCTLLFSLVQHLVLYMYTVWMSKNLVSMALTNYRTNKYTKKTGTDEKMKGWIERSSNILISASRCQLSYTCIYRSDESY